MHKLLAVRTDGFSQSGGGGYKNGSGGGTGPLGVGPLPVELIAQSRLRPGGARRVYGQRQLQQRVATVFELVVR